MSALRLISHDLFDIAARLKEIDENYELYFNYEKNRYEIYAYKTLQLAVPYKRLDARTLRLARETRLEYIDNLMRDIERFNAALEKEKESKTRDKILSETEAIL